MSVLTSPFLLCFLFIGLFACFSELQHPIRHSFSFRLDFCLHSHCFNVQSDTFFRPFWTFSVTFSTSTSNLTRFLIPFGLLLAFPLLQRPICTSQQKVDTTLYFYTSFNEHNTPYTVLESDNSESMPDVLH